MNAHTTNKESRQASKKKGKQDWLQEKEKLILLTTDSAIDDN